VKRFKLPKRLNARDRIPLYRVEAQRCPTLL
jgi:hypothetical protein